MTVDYEQVARIVAAQTPNLDFDDVYQECMLKLLAYPPRSLAGAYRIASSARNSLWRKERRHTGHANINNYQPAEPSHPDVRELGIFEQVHKVLPKEVDWLIAYYRDDTAKKPGKDAKRAYDYRRRIREVWQLLSLPE